MITDLNLLRDGDVIFLHPRPSSELTEPVKVTFIEGGFYHIGSDYEQPPVYSLSNVLQFNCGFTANH